MDLQSSLAETMATIAEHSGGMADLEGGAALFACAAPDPVPWNGALRTAPRLKADDLLERAAAFFEPLERRYGIITLEGLDDEVDARLEQLGISPALRAPAMLATTPLAEERVDGLAMQTVDTDELRRDCLAVLADAFEGLGEDPGNWEKLYPSLESVHGDEIITLLATLGGESLGAGMVYLGSQGAELMNIGTLPGHRGQGIGAQLTSTLTNLALDRRAAFVALQATEMGAGVYRNLGFRDAGAYHWYLPPD